MIQFVSRLDLLLVTGPAKDVGMAFKPTNFSMWTQPIWKQYARQKGFIFRSFRDNEVNKICETTT